MSYPANNITLRNITDNVNNNAIYRISLIPIFINKRKYTIKFYIGTAFQRNFLGSDFLVNTKASVIFQDKIDSHVLVINNVLLPLEYLYLNEVMGNTGILNKITKCI